MEMFRRTYAEINLDHLAHNVALIQKHFAQSPFLCPMVKANAYGHGDVQVARYLEQLGIEHLGVCLIEEGLLLRNFGVKAQILVFRGFDREGAKKIVDFNLTPVVSSWEQLEHLETVSPTQVQIHLKFDTGMNRLGFKVAEAEALRKYLWQNSKIELKAIVTHLFNGEDAYIENAHSAQQLNKILHIKKIFKDFHIFYHTLNSAGILSHLYLRTQKSVSSQHPLLAEEWGLRPGLMLYGYNPLSAHFQFDLKPVMSLKSQTSVFRILNVGETVSYGGRWQAQRRSIIAVVPIGYADGYHRILSNQAYALFDGNKVPVVGSVCMDYLMLDVTEVVTEAQLSELKEVEVVLFGTSKKGSFLSPEELADKASSITWEMLTSVGERVPRVYIGQHERFVNNELGGV